MPQKNPVVLHSLQRVFQHCLQARKEKILILGGADSSMISELYCSAAESLRLNAELVLSDSSQKLTEKLESLERRSIVIFHKTKKTALDLKQNIRSFCRKQKHRFILASGVESTGMTANVLKSLNLDFGKLQEEQAKIKDVFDKAKEVHVTTDAGTDLHLDVRNTTAVSSHGIYDRPGTGGNLPTGEVYFAPRKAEGTVAVDVSSRNRWGTVRVDHPIMLEIENSTVQQVVDGINGTLLGKTIEDAEEVAQQPRKVRRLAEFGLGMNPAAQACGTTLIDEKVRGTAHVAIGSNHWFGGRNKTKLHVDQVFDKPRLEIDGSPFAYCA